MLDKTIRDRACFYCGRPGTECWPSGRFSCSHSVCKSLAYASEVAPRRLHASAVPPTHVQVLQWALRRAETTIRKAEELDREFDERWHRHVAAESALSGRASPTTAGYAGSAS